MATIMIIEDDIEINALIKLHLERAGHQVIAKKDGIFLETETLDHIDLFILDVMLPMVDGFELIQVIRRKTPRPILMVTAMTGESDRIRGLDLGADDYVCKPFSISELLSRVNAHLRRVETYLNLNAPADVMTCGDIAVDVLKHTCTKNGVDVPLNPIEFKMLKYFMTNEGIALSKDKIYENVWEEAYYGDDNTIMVHIRRLREKIEDTPNTPTYLLTVRGVGYKFCNGGAEQ